MITVPPIESNSETTLEVYFYGLTLSPGEEVEGLLLVGGAEPAFTASYLFP